MASTYIRYLIDVCETIFVAPSLNHEFNPDLTNPYIDVVNHFIVMTESIIMPDEKVSIKEIEATDNKIKYLDLDNYMSSSDFSKQISKIHINFEKQYEEMKYEVNYALLVKSSYKPWDYKKMDY